MIRLNSYQEFRTALAQGKVVYGRVTHRFGELMLPVHWKPKDLRSSVVRDTITKHLECATKGYFVQDNA